MSEHRFLMSLRAAIRSGSAFGDSGVEREKLVGLNNMLNEDIASRAEDITSRANDLEGPAVDRKGESTCEVLGSVPN